MLNLNPFQVNGSQPSGLRPFLFLPIAKGETPNTSSSAKGRQLLGVADAQVSAESTRVSAFSLPLQCTHRALRLGGQEVMQSTENEVYTRRELTPPLSVWQCACLTFGIQHVDILTGSVQPSFPFISAHSCSGCRPRASVKPESRPSGLVNALVVIWGLAPD